MGKLIFLDHNPGLRRYGELRREIGASRYSCREREDRNWRVRRVNSMWGSKRRGKRGGTYGLFAE